VRLTGRPLKLKLGDRRADLAGLRRERVKLGPHGVALLDLPG
jgi:hypothetical protein